MSKELQEKADKMVEELKEALVPITDEIRRLNGKNSGGGRRI